MVKRINAIDNIIRKCVIYKGFVTVSTVEGFGVNGRFSIIITDNVDLSKFFNAQ